MRESRGVIRDKVHLHRTSVDEARYALDSYTTERSITNVWKCKWLMAETPLRMRPAKSYFNTFALYGPWCVSAWNFARLRVLSGACDLSNVWASTLLNFSRKIVLNSSKNRSHVRSTNKSWTDSVNVNLEIQRISLKSFSDTNVLKSNHTHISREQTCVVKHYEASRLGQHSTEKISRREISTD